MLLQQFYIGKQTVLCFFRSSKQVFVCCGTGDKVGITDVSSGQQRVDPAVQNILIRLSVLIKQLVVAVFDADHHEQAGNDQEQGNPDGDTIAKQQAVF